MSKRTRLMKTFPEGVSLRSDRMTYHHVIAKVRGGQWSTENILGLREQRHGFYNNLFGERDLAEAASIVDSLVSALAREDKFLVALVQCRRRWERIKFERGHRGPLPCLVFWQDKREHYQRFFRRERPDPRDAAALRRAMRMLKARALRKQVAEAARRRSRSAREEEFAAVAFAS